MFDRIRALILTTGLAAAVVPLGAQGANVRQAQRGDAITGVPLSDDGNVLQLDTTPCAASRSLVVFQQPYTTEAAGTIHCGGVAKVVVQAIKR